VQAMTGSGLWIAQVTNNPPPTPVVEGVPSTMGNGFASISPDDSQVAVAWGGKLWTVDRASGALGQNITLPGMMKATHPDWSPDNTQLVFATGSGDAPAGASLAVVPYTKPGWGTATTIVASTGMMQSNLFPMFSPDGKWIAFSRGKGGHGDVTAQLFVVGADGKNPTELVNANRVVSNVLGTGQTENNQPTWAPPGDLYWVAFNSQRAYGVVQGAGTQQIWVAAVDPAKLGGSGDPSFPAFRLQFQGLTENNHRAFWTLDVRDDPDGGAPPDMTPLPPDMTPPPACVPMNVTCDPVSSTCCDSGYTCDSTDNGVTYKCIDKGVIM
jgi:Tol biopolymer transport system component